MPRDTMTDSFRSPIRPLIPRGLVGFDPDFLLNRSGAVSVPGLGTRNARLLKLDIHESTLPWQGNGSLAMNI